MNNPPDGPPVYYYGFSVTYLMLSLIFIVIFALIIQIAISIWIYKDAKKRNMEAAIWVLIVLLFSIVGVIIYLIVRGPIVLKESIQPTYIAPITNSYIPKHHTLYNSPIPRESSEKFCLFCGKKMSFDANFCPHCGKEA